MKKTPNLLTATEAVREIRNGNLTATELMRACADRIGEVEPAIKAWAYFDEELAMNYAQAVDHKLSGNKTPGRLCGIPVGIKDIFNTKDMPTCMGSPIWEDFTPGNDARVVSYLKWAGAVIAGKTVTAEFAVHHPGPTINPHNSNHTPGTSSSGSAAAVAAYMVPLSLGTQTAGSTIRPASNCGIFGFKPSFGLIPRTGILKTLDTLDHVSFLTRSVEDLRLMLDTLRVRGSNHPYVYKNIDCDNEATRTPGRPYKIGFVKTPVWRYAEGYAQNALVAYAEALSQHPEITIEEVELPLLFNEVHAIHEKIYTKALSYYFRDEVTQHSDKISKWFKSMVDCGQKISPEDYRRGLQQQNSLINELDGFIRDYDALLSLSTAGEAPLGLDAESKPDSCLIWTLCHVPAISIPLFKGPKGLPFGVQVIGRRYSDYRLLNLLDSLHQWDLLQLWADL